MILTLNYLRLPRLSDVRGIVAIIAARTRRSHLDRTRGQPANQEPASHRIFKMALCRSRPFVSFATNKGPISQGARGVR